MPWRQTSPMDQKTQFIADYLRRTLSLTELCERYAVSRKTGDTWIERYLKHGPLGLEERSRKPHSSPHQTPTHVVEALIELRRHHPSWGAKKLLSILQNRHPSGPLPARSTVCEILRRHGVVPKKQHRRPIGHPGNPPARSWPPTMSGAPISRATSKPATGSTAIRSPWPMATAAFCLAVKRSLPPAWSRPSPCSSACSKNLVCPSASAPTTGCPVPPTRSAGSHTCPPGGSAWGSSLNSSSPANPSKTAAMSACIVHSKLRPPAPRPPPGAPSNAHSIASAKNSTSNAPMKPSICKPSRTL